MNIEDNGELKTFEAMPVDVTLYLTAVRYESTGWWISGPSSQNKADLIKAIESWTGIDAARIYSVKLPAKRFSAS